MKKIILAVLACSVLSGCASEIKHETFNSSNEDVIKYVTEQQPACDGVQDLYTANLNEMHRRESLGLMNAQEDAQRIQEAKQACNNAPRSEGAVQQAVAATLGGIGAGMNAAADAQENSEAACLQSDYCRWNTGQW
ncbi:hypothetical protein PYR66_09975 [Klebsiella aerogenes]|nr:hypothetical protein PYR66_09975 [Klebsiella aerogenes]